MMTAKAARLAVVVGASVAFGLALLGVTPFLLSFVAFVALWLSQRARWGAATALGVAVLAWTGCTFLAMCLAPALPFDMAIEVAIIHLTVAVFAARYVREPLPAIRGEERSGADVAATLVGTVLWLVAVVVSHVVPRGTGWSWAVYVDSSLDVFSMRTIAEYGGVNSVVRSNPRPLEHSLSASALPWQHPIDSSSLAVSQEITAHATVWAFLVALSCLLAALVVHRMLGATSLAPGLRRIVVAGSSLVMLMGPIAGVAFFRGQINTHVVWVIVFATVLVGFRARAHAAEAVAWSIVATTLLMLTWTPFAAIPGLLALLLAWRHRRELVAGGQRAVLTVLVAVGLFAWSVARFAWHDLQRSAVPGNAQNASRVEIATVLPNPAWLPLTVLLLAIVAFGAVALRRSASDLTPSSWAMVGGVAIGIVYTGASGGLELIPESYYPARYLHLASGCLVPLAIGWSLALMTSKMRRARWSAAILSAAVVLAAVFGPLNPQVPRWAFAPVDLLTGAWHGTRDDVANTIVSYADDEVARLAWRTDSRFDYHVNWMLSVLEPGPRTIFNTPFASSLRNHGPDFSAERACDVGASSTRPVILMTRDEHLAGEIAALCAAQRIQVEVVPVTN